MKIHRDIFQWDMQSTFQFVIAMMSLNHVIMKYTGGYKLTKSQRNINHIDDITLFVRNVKERETIIKIIRMYIQDIGMEFGIEKMCHTNNEKWRTTNNGRNKTTKSRKNQNARRKSLQALYHSPIRPCVKWTYNVHIYIYI